MIEQEALPPMEFCSLRLVLIRPAVLNPNREVRENCNIGDVADEDKFLKMMKRLRARLLGGEGS